MFCKSLWPSSIELNVQGIDGTRKIYSTVLFGVHPVNQIQNIGQCNSQLQITVKNNDYLPKVSHSLIIKRIFFFFLFLSSAALSPERKSSNLNSFHFDLYPQPLVCY